MSKNAWRNSNNVRLGARLGCHLHSKQNFHHCTTFPASRGLNGERKTIHRERPLIAVNVKLSGGGGGGISFLATYYGGRKFLFSFWTCRSLYRQENSPTNDILTELDKSPLLSPGNVIVKACEKCSQREATTRVEFVTLLLKEVSFLWSSITVTLTFTNVALNHCTTCMLECVLRVHPEFKILSLYLFIHLFVYHYLQGLNHLLESRTFTFVMSSLTQNKMTTEFYEVSS